MSGQIRTSINRLLRNPNVPLDSNRHVTVLALIERGSKRSQCLRHSLLVGRFCKSNLDKMFLAQSRRIDFLMLCALQWRNQLELRGFNPISCVCLDNSFVVCFKRNENCSQLCPFNTELFVDFSPQTTYALWSFMSKLGKSIYSNAALYTDIAQSNTAILYLALSVCLAACAALD